MGHKDDTMIPGGGEVGPTRAPPTVYGIQGITARFMSQVCGISTYRVESSHAHGSTAGPPMLFSTGCVLSISACTQLLGHVQGKPA